MTKKYDFSEVATWWIVAFLHSIFEIISYLKMWVVEYAE